MQPSLNHVNAHLDIKWKADTSNPVLVENMQERCWRKAGRGESDWNFYWLSVRLVKNFFSPHSDQRLAEGQLVSHFPNYFELTQKDLLASNITAHRFRVHGLRVALHGGKPLTLSSNIIPTTYVLPRDYETFLEAFCKDQSKPWIFKPAGRSRGRGIQLIDRVAVARKLRDQMARANLTKAIKQTFVISRYIGRPTKTIRFA